MTINALGAREGPSEESEKGRQGETWLNTREVPRIRREVTKEVVFCSLRYFSVTGDANPLNETLKG